MTDPTDLPSVTAALGAIDDTVAKMDELTKTLAKERVIRNNLIRDAASAQVRQKELVRRSKLSRQQVTTIINTAYEVEA